jgi:F-type H+-transporting ATPase subunit delta
MIAGSLARRYARALLEVGNAKGNTEQIVQELDDLGKSFAGSRDLTEAMTNPVFPRTRRRAVLEAVLERASVSQATRNFMLVLLEGDRIEYLSAISRELGEMLDAQVGRVRATVTAARPLPAEFGATIQGALAQASGKQVVLETREDSSLIGGVVAQIGDVVYDGSIRTQLERLRERFLT